MSCMLILLSSEKALCKTKVLINKCWDYDLSGEDQWIPTQAHRLWHPCLHLYLLLLLLATSNACPPPAPHTILWQPKEPETSKDRGGRWEHTNESSKPGTSKFFNSDLFGEVDLRQHPKTQTESNRKPLDIAISQISVPITYQLWNLGKFNKLLSAS